MDTREWVFRVAKYDDDDDDDWLIFSELHKRYQLGFSNRPTWPVRPMGLAGQILLPDWSEGGKESWETEMNRIGLENDCIEYKTFLLHTPLAAGLVKRPATSLSTSNSAD